MIPTFALNSLLGNGGTVTNLRAALAAGRLSHAVLLCAPDGCGRGFLSRLLAADYLFPPAGEANVHRESGVKAVLEGHSPEVITLLGQGASGQISVEAVREARQNIFQSSLSAAGRVVLVPSAHRMTPAAANALLKVLEEPPSHALFILSAPGPGSLPATIVSRCAVYSLAPLPEETCLVALRQAVSTEGLEATEGDLNLLCSLYGGRLGLCLKALRQPLQLETARDAAALAGAAARGDRYTMLRLFSRYEGRGDEERNRRNQLLQDLQEVLAASLLDGARPPLPQTGRAFAAAALPPVGEARAALNQNAAAKTTFTALAVTLGALAL